MKFHVVLRETEDWNNVNVENFWENKENKQFKCFHEDQAKYDRMKANLDKWNSCSMSFFQFRQKLKEIAQEYHLTTPLTPQEALEIKDKQVVFLPIDDDDLVHPDLLGMLEEAFQDPDVDCVDFLSWCHATFMKREHYYVENYKTDKGNYLVSSNAYAIRSTCAKEKLLTNHVIYSDSSNLKRLLIKEKKWGLRFLHSASMCYCQRLDISPYLVDKKRAIRPSDLDWAADAIENVFKLTSSLENRKLFL